LLIKASLKIIKASLKIIKASMKIIKASLQRSGGLLVATLLVIPVFVHFNVINRSLPAAALRFYFSPLLMQASLQRSGKNKTGSYSDTGLWLWGGRWDSNPRHLEPQSSALTN
jgi:hypothetical protein